MALASAALAPLALIIATSLPANADAGDDPCQISTYHYCLDLPADSATLQIDNGSSNYDAYRIGTVTSSWPFTSSAWNSHYSGKTVWKITRGTDQSDCMRTDAALETPARVYVATGQACSDNEANVLWVVSGDWLINVNQTYAGSSYASILQTQCINKGCYVYSDYSDNASNPQREWTALNIGLEQ